jgi:hypothetical protein
MTNENARRWVQKIQGQAVEKGRPYVAAESHLLADSAHSWANYYGVRVAHADCVVAARELTGVSL